MSIYDTLNRSLYRLDSSSRLIPATNLDIDPSDIGSGSVLASLFQNLGGVASGKTKFDNTETGYILGVDDGVGKFYIGDTTSYLNWTGTALNISGTLTAGSIDIGGSDATSFHVDSDGNMWLGDATYAAAPFKVSNAGALTASSATITGGAITGTSLASIPNSTATDISLMECSHNLVFSVTDADTIAWATGTIVFSNGRTFSIDAGNTGDMAALTYIYLDPAVSSTVLQTSTTYSTAMGANKRLLGTAQNHTITAHFIPYGPGQLLVDGANIGALSIVAGNIAASTITAGKLSVSQLSAIAADLGTITAGSISVVNGGNTIGLTPAGANAIFSGTTGSPEFKVTPAGAVTASNITITGGSVGASVTVALGALNIAAQGWTQTCAFSVTDADTVAWGAGTLTTAAGTAYSIDAGNTGNMVAKTYIYLDIAVSTTVYQVTTTAATAVGAGKILVATAQNATAEAVYAVLSGQGGQNIDATNIVAGSVTANEIAAGTITAGLLSISQLSAISADLGSVTAGSITVVSGGNTIGLTPLGANAIFSGTTGSPEFKVTPAGAVTASNITITGGSVVTSILSGTIGLTNLGLAIRGWTQTCAFSVTDADTVAWGAGSFTSADGGTVYSIDAGNTGNMAAKTYVYLDTGVSTTVYQTTTTASTAVGAGKVLIAIAQNGTGEATFQVMDGQGGQNIDAASIVAGSITTNEIAAGYVYAGAIAVSQLTAGSITSKDIVLAISDGTGDVAIRAGKSDFTNTDSGFILGLDDSDSNLAKFYIGDSSTYLNWDGVTLTIKGRIAAKGFFGGDGSDGALSISSGTTTIDCANAKVVIKNYTSISITSTGKLAFSNPHASGTIVILKSQGNVVLTSSTDPNIDMSGMGAAGGDAGTAGGDGGNGTTAVPLIDTSAHAGVGGSGAGPTAAGAVYASAGLYTLTTGQYWTFGRFVACGSGGGGGKHDTVNAAGAGGRGGGALMIECAGDLNATGNITVAGLVGGNGTSGSGGGGGGSGGSCIVLYNTATAVSGTISDAGGAGGNGGGSAYGGSGAGGIGGAGGTGGQSGGANVGDAGGGAGGGAAGSNSGASGGAGGAASTSAGHYIQV